MRAQASLDDRPQSRDGSTQPTRFKAEPDPRGSPSRGGGDTRRGPLTRDNRDPLARDNRAPSARDNRASLARDNRDPSARDNRGPLTRDNRASSARDNRPTHDDNAPPTRATGSSPNRGPLPPLRASSTMRGKRAQLRVLKPLRDAVNAGHPWIYDRALAAPSGIDVGDVVTLVDEQGPLATALVDPSSPLRARVLDLRPDATCDGRWARERVEAAAARRIRDPLLVGCTGRRIVHGEGDACPGLVIDVYADTAVIVFDGPAAAVFWRARLDDVLAGLERGGIRVAHAWLKGERRDRSAGEAVRGDPPAEIVMSEDEARFAVDVRAGQKTGFFLDQRDNRRTIRKHAAGASVLNLFSYTGGFSLHAALGGASRVTSVDIAPAAVAAIERNVMLSGLAAETHERVASDCFEFLTRAKAQGRRWDLVICDPPSFAPSERAKGPALRAYEKLAVASLEVVAPGGRFAFASCSSHVTEADLLEVSAYAGLKAGANTTAANRTQPANLRLRHSAGAASDHPVVPAFSEGRYLKFLFFDVG